MLAEKAAQVTGVGDVTVGGGRCRRWGGAPATGSYRVRISLDHVRQAISSANLRRPKGMIEDSERHWQIQASDQLVSAQEYQPLIVTYRNGAPVRLSDVARVFNGVEGGYNSGYFNHKPAVLLVVSRQAQATIATVDGVTAQLPALRAFLPAGVSLDIASDRSPTIRATLREAAPLLIAVGLVILVVLLFLGRLRAAMNPVAAVPGCPGGQLCGDVSLGLLADNLSLMALIVATGLVVDYAIVGWRTSAATSRRKTPLAVAFAGPRGRSASPSVDEPLARGGLLSILFMGGIVERLFREFRSRWWRPSPLAGGVDYSDADAVCALARRPRRRQAGAMQVSATASSDRSRRLRAHALLGAGALADRADDFHRRRRVHRASL